jgi:hypothetical protein
MRAQLRRWHRVNGALLLGSGGAHIGLMLYAATARAGHFPMQLLWPDNTTYFGSRVSFGWLGAVMLLLALLPLAVPWARALRAWHAVALAALAPLSLHAFGIGSETQTPVLIALFSLLGAVLSMLLLARLQRRYRASALALLLVLLLPWPAASETLPPGASWMGLTDAGWRYCLADTQGYQCIEQIGEVRQASWSPVRDTIAYQALDGSLHEWHRRDGSDRLLVRGDDVDGYAQPRYLNAGTELWAVRLPGRKSATATLVRWNDTVAGFEPVPAQPGACFDPDQRGDDLVYAHSGCAAFCEPLRLELWHTQLRNGHSRQLTRLQGIVRQPVLDADGRSVVFSARRDGGYRLWRYRLDSGNLQPLTADDADDREPALAADGSVYFIRRAFGRGRIMRLRNGMLTELVLPAGTRDVRDLELVP